MFHTVMPSSQLEVLAGAVALLRWRFLARPLLVGLHLARCLFGLANLIHIRARVGFQAIDERTLKSCNFEAYRCKALASHLQD